AQDPGRYPPRVRRGRARGLWFDSAFAPWAVLLHETGAGAGLGRVGAPAPGAKGAGSVLWFDSAFAPWAVLLQETGAGAGVWMVGAPAPGANAGVRGGYRVWNRTDCISRRRLRVRWKGKVRAPWVYSSSRGTSASMYNGTPRS